MGKLSTVYRYKQVFDSPDSFLVSIFDMITNSKSLGYVYNPDLSDTYGLREIVDNPADINKDGIQISKSYVYDSIIQHSQ